LDKLARGFHAFAFVDAVLQPVEDECRRIYTRTISLKSPGRIRGDTGCRRGEGNKNPAREIAPHQRNPCRLGSVQNRLLGFVAAGGICHTNKFNRAVVEDAKKTQVSSTTRRPGRRLGLGLGRFGQIDFPQSAHWATTDLAARAVSALPPRPYSTWELELRMQLRVCEIAAVPAWFCLSGALRNRRRNSA
jgi:hypothetical protein